MGKKLGTGSGINNRNALNQVFGLKYFNSLITDAGMEKIRIRDGKNSDPG
jgi:hypothetical protein